MVDFQTNKITLYTGINDIPTPPSDLSGSNISHVHDEHNKLVDNVISKTTEIDTKIENIEATLSDLDTINTSLTNIQNQINNLNSEIGNLNIPNVDALTERIFNLENAVAQLEAESLGDVTEFFIENVNFQEVEGIFEYSFLSPKTGQLTEIGFNDADSLSDLSIEYNGQNTILTSPNLGTDPEYPYILVPQSSSDIQQDGVLRIFTPNQETNITNIKLIII